jgi:hypothetical protein
MKNTIIYLFLFFLSTNSNCAINEVRTRLNYFGDYELTVKIKLPSNTYSPISQDDKEILISDLNFLELWNQVKSNLLNLTQISDPSNQEYFEGFKKIPPEYRPMMLKEILSEEGKVYKPEFALQTMRNDLLNHLKVAFGDNYEGAFKNPVFNGFFMGTGSTYYYDSRTSGELQANEILKSFAENGTRGDAKNENSPRPYLYKNFAGEITASMARHVNGQEYINKYFMDGVGSGNFRFQNNFRYFQPEDLKTQSEGGTFGKGLSQNAINMAYLIKARLGLLVDDDFSNSQKPLNPNLRVELFLINEFSKQTYQDETGTEQSYKIKKLNLLGWSRGAMTCIFLTNLLTDKSLTIGKEVQKTDLKIFLAAIDPVPGPFIRDNSFFHNNQISQLSELVEKYVGFYAEHELSAFFEAWLPGRKDRSATEKIVLNFPGHHATLAGSSNYNRNKPQQAEQLKILEKIHKIIRFYVKDLFVKRGDFEIKRNTQFEDLTDAEIISFYEEIFREDQKDFFKKMATNKEDFYQNFASINLNPLAYLRAWFFKDKTKSNKRNLLNGTNDTVYSADQYPEFTMNYPESFVNTHHEDLVMKQKGGWNDEILDENEIENKEGFYLNNETSQQFQVYYNDEVLSLAPNKELHRPKEKGTVHLGLVPDLNFNEQSHEKYRPLQHKKTYVVHKEGQVYLLIKQGNTPQYKISSFSSLSDGLLKELVHFDLNEKKRTDLWTFFNDKPSTKYKNFKWSNIKNSYTENSSNPEQNDFLNSVISYYRNFERDYRVELGNFSSYSKKGFKQVHSLVLDRLKEKTRKEIKLDKKEEFHILTAKRPFFMQNENKFIRFEENKFLNVKEKEKASLFVLTDANEMQGFCLARINAEKKSLDFINFKDASLEVKDNCQGALSINLLRDATKKWSFVFLPDKTKKDIFFLSSGEQGLHKVENIDYEKTKLEQASRKEEKFDLISI